MSGLNSWDGVKLGSPLSSSFDEFVLLNSIFSIDNCDNTGDHENFFDKSTDAYAIDGTKYTNCSKLAVRYRSKEEHKLLSSLSQTVFLLIDGRYYFPVDHKQFSDEKTILNPKYSWVISFSLNIVVTWNISSHFTHKGSIQKDRDTLMRFVQTLI